MYIYVYGSYIQYVFYNTIYFYSIHICIVAGDAMSTKPVGYRPMATQQNFDTGYDRGSDRLAASSKETTVDRGRAAVGGGDGTYSGLSQCLVKFVWFPSDPFKVHETKATLLSSFTVSYFT